MRGCFLVHSSLIKVVYLKCSTTKNMCSKQVEDCFLVYSSLIKCQMFYYKKCLFKARRTLLFSLFIINHHYTHKVFFLRILKKVRKGCLLNYCFLVYSSNFIRVPLATSFYLT